MTKRPVPFSLLALLALAAATLVAARARSEEAKPFTVSQCLTIERGLRALNYVGAQLDDQRPVPPDARQYKLGPLRMTIAMNLAALGTVSLAVQQARVGLLREINADGKGLADGTPEMARFLAAFQQVLDKTCDVAPARLKLADLRVGDGPEENAIPPGVLAAIAPIIER